MPDPAWLRYDGQTRAVATTRTDELVAHEPGDAGSPDDDARTLTIEDAAVWPRVGLQPGHRMGRYRIDSVRGAGAMGTVYAAYDERLHRGVAIKVLHPSRAGRADHRDRIRSEARAMATVSHPGVVPVYDVGEHEGHLFVVMALVDHVDLAAWLAQPHDMAARMRVVLTAARGVAAAHRAGLVHRDIKPANILVTAQGDGRVTDFGLAVGPAIDGDGEHRREIAGTPAYMAPEQHRGQLVDARADQYALCTTAWEVLVGRRPFDTQIAPSLAEAKLQGSPPIQAVAGVPRRIIVALARGLRPRPQDRWPTIDALLAALGRRPTRRWGWFAGAATVALLVGLTVPRDDRCRPGLQILAQAWAQPRRARVQQALGSTLGQGRAAGVISEIDDRVVSWSRAYQGACDQGPRVAELVDPQRRCLARVRRQLVSWIEVAEHSPRRASWALSSVAGVTECEHAPPPGLEIDDPQQYEAIEAELAQGWSARVQGEYADAEQALTRAARRAGHAGHPEQLVVALRRLGSVHDIQGHADQALQTLREALRVAEELHSDRAIAAVWIELVPVLVGRSELPEAERAVRAAAAALTRSGEDRRLEAARLTNMAALRGAQGRDDEGVAALRDAMALWSTEVERPWLRDVAVVSLEQNLAWFALRNGDMDVALELMTSARRRWERRLGPDGPTVAEIELDLAGVYDTIGDTASARLHVERAQQSLEGQQDAPRALLARVEVLLAYAAHADGALRQAADHLGRAADLRIEQFGPQDAEARFHRANLAQVRFDLGDTEDAHQLAQAAKLGIGDTDAPRPRDVVVLATAGEIAMRTGRRELGRSDLLRALTAIEGAFGPQEQARTAALERIAALFEEQGEPHRASEIREQIGHSAVGDTQRDLGGD